MQVVVMLVVTAVLAASGCGHADAEPGQPAADRSGLTPPKGWRPLPAVVAAVSLVAPAPGVTVDGIESWGHTSMGCYALWIALHGSGGSPEALAQQVLDGLAAEKIAVSDVVTPSGEGVLALTLDRKPYRGRLRARVEDGKLTALACVHDQREPLACETACTGVLEALR